MKAMMKKPVVKKPAMKKFAAGGAVAKKPVKKYADGGTVQMQSTAGMTPEQMQAIRAQQQRDMQAQQQQQQAAAPQQFGSFSAAPAQMPAGRAQREIEGRNQMMMAKGGAVKKKAVTAKGKKK